MPGGYAGRLAEIDLSKGTVKEVTLPEDVLKDYVGGRALGAWITWQRLKDKPWESVDPLGPDNVLIFITGPVNGLYPGSRTCVTGKSPLSNGILGSSAGSWFDAAMKMAGWDGFIITGRATSPVYLWVFDDTIEIRDASKYWGKRVTEARNGILREIRSELAKKRPSRWPKVPAITLIGPAGENKVRNSAVIFDQEKAAGRGGYGAVMGSKNLKAVVVYGTKPLPEPANKDAWKTLWTALMQRNIQRYGAYRRWGTARGLWQFGWWTASLPIRNWQDEWHENIIAGPHEYEHGLWVRQFWARCWMCVQHCYKTAVVRQEGRPERLVSELPDYENQATHGSILDEWDPDQICMNTTLANELGYDTIGIGNTIAFAFELYEKGILTKDDTGGLELKWGNSNAWRAMLEKVARREGWLGEALALGEYRAALEIAKRKGLPPEKVLYYAIQCKGIEWGAHGIRSGLDYTRWTITYAVSVQGGDHTSIASPRLEDYELTPIVNDTAMFCSFTAPPIDQAAMWLTAVTGWSYSVDTLKTVAMRAIMIQRAALLLGGPDVRWVKDGKALDENPGRMVEEPLPSGPVKGKRVDPETFKKELATYYETHGYDENGIPKSEVLRALGLPDVDEALNRVRKK